MSKYGIDFAESFTRPPETMVGECVYDEDGNHVGWVTVGELTCHVESKLLIEKWNTRKEPMQTRLELP